MRGRASRAGLAALMGVAAAAGGVIAGGSPAWAHHQVTATYTATGGEQVWNVPAGVTNVHVVVVGARGGNALTPGTSGGGGGGGGGGWYGGGGGSSGGAACVIADVAQPLADDAKLSVSAGYAGNSFYEPSQAAATVGLQHETGRAYGLSGKLKVLVGTATLPAAPDSGAVRTADPSTTATPCTATVNVLVLRAGALCANVTTRTAPGGSTATATVGSVELGLPGLPAIALRDIRTTSVTDCAGSTGAVTVGQLLIGGVAVTVTTGPNSTVAIPGVPGAKIVFNEQVPVDGGLTVNGVRIVVPQTLGVSADLVLASATSDIHLCR